MSLERVIEAILQRGQVEAQEILDSARQEREGTLSEVATKGEDLFREREQQAKEQTAREKLREIARAELGSKKTALQAQKEVLDDIIDRAKRRLRERPPSEDLLKNLVDAHQEELAGGFVLCNGTDLSILRKLVKCEVRDELDCIGGFVIESEDGSRRIDLTYDTFLEDLWEDTVKEVANVLWGES